MDANATNLTADEHRCTRIGAKPVERCLASEADSGRHRRKGSAAGGQRCGYMFYPRSMS